MRNESPGFLLAGIVIFLILVSGACYTRYRNYEECRYHGFSAFYCYTTVMMGNGR